MNTNPDDQLNLVTPDDIEIHTFMGLPAARDLAAVDAKVAIIGIPCAVPYPGIGAYCAGGPAAIREGTATREGYASQSAKLMNYDFDLGGPIFKDGNVSVVDCGDLEYDERDSAQNRLKIRAAIETLLDRGAVPIIIGGDDSSPIPVFEAFQGKGKITIIQIDAHIDWLDEVNGERWCGSSPMRRASEMPHVERIIQVGQRGLSSARLSDVEDALRWGVDFISAQAVFEKGVQQIIDLVPEGSNVVFSFDCDGLDPSIMPAVIAPSPGGLNLWHALDIMHGVAAKAKISAFNLVELMPERDVDNRGALLAGRVIVNAMGIAVRQSDKC